MPKFRIIVERRIRSHLGIEVDAESRGEAIDLALEEAEQTGKPLNWKTVEAGWVVADIKDVV